MGYIIARYSSAVSQSGEAMLVRLVRFALVIAALAVPVAARADDLADFNAAVERAAVHNRAAIGYLRTGNIDLGAVELDRLRTAWEQVGTIKRPAAFDAKLYVMAMTDIAMRLVTADMLLNSGRAENTRQSLIAVRDDLYTLRTAAHVPVLADCVKDANTAMAALLAYDDRNVDFGKSGADIAAKANTYGATLKRCDGMAGASIRQEPEFRRLIDGAQASLTFIPKAVDTHDAGLLHRVLDELRAFDNLMAFRFG